MPSWNENARLVDVSHWNAEEDGRTHHRLMDWPAAVKSNLVGVIPKYTQGLGGTDPAAYLHAFNAYSAGVPLLGSYHFGDGSDPQKQAARYLDAVHGDYKSLDGIMLMLDAERNQPQMSVRQAELFVTTIKTATGRWPWLYMGHDGPDGTGKGLPSAILANCQLLLPAYGEHRDLTPILPKGFRMPKDGGDRGEAGIGLVRGWQFTDGAIHGGPFPGLGKVDQSKLIGFASLEEAKAAWAA
jgi:lysozyme